VYFDVACKQFKIHSRLDFKRRSFAVLQSCYVQRWNQDTTDRTSRMAYGYRLRDSSLARRTQTNTVIVVKDKLRAQLSRVDEPSNMSLCKPAIAPQAPSHSNQEFTNAIPKRVMFSRIDQLFMTFLSSGNSRQQRRCWSTRALE
jgi:hypothetical protein